MYNTFEIKRMRIISNAEFRKLEKKCYNGEFSFDPGGPSRYQYLALSPRPIYTHPGRSRDNSQTLNRAPQSHQTAGPIKIRPLSRSLHSGVYNSIGRAKRVLGENSLSLSRARMTHNRPTFIAVNLAASYRHYRKHAHARGRNARRGGRVRGQGGGALWLIKSWPSLYPLFVWRVGVVRGSLCI